MTCLAAVFVACYESKLKKKFGVPYPTSLLTNNHSYTFTTSTSTSLYLKKAVLFIKIFEYQITKKTS